MTRVLILLLSATVASAQSWMQWGANARHESAVGASGQRLDRIEAEVVIDPFVIAEKTLAGGSLLTHYPVPLVDGDDLFVILKGGSFIDFQHRSSQTWSCTRCGATDAASPRAGRTRATGNRCRRRAARRDRRGRRSITRAMTADAVWAPGAGGTIDRSAASTARASRASIRSARRSTRSIFMAGPPAVDDAGNIYYNAIQLDTSSPWTSDARGAWLVRIGADGTASKVAFSVDRHRCAAGERTVHDRVPQLAAAVAAEPHRGRADDHLRLAASRHQRRAGDRARRHGLHDQPRALQRSLGLSRRRQSESHAEVDARRCAIGSMTAAT